MGSGRWRPAAPVLAAVLGALIAACGPAAHAAHRPPRRPTAVTLQGSLLQVRSNTLTVQQGAGPVVVRVSFDPMATPIYAVTSVTPEAIEPGACVAARGVRDATGTVTASALVLASSADDTCAADSEPPPPAPDPSPSAPAPSPPTSPLPGPGPVLLQGQVLSLGGGVVEMKGPQGDPQVVLLPPGVPILLFQPSGPAALVVPSCVAVQGTGSRRSITAHKIVDWPPGTGTAC